MEAVRTSLKLQADSFIFIFFLRGGRAVAGGLRMAKLRKKGGMRKPVALLRGFSAFRGGCGGQPFNLY